MIIIGGPLIPLRRLLARTSTTVLVVYVAHYRGKELYKNEIKIKMRFAKLELIVLVCGRGYNKWTGLTRFAILDYYNIVLLCWCSVQYMQCVQFSSFCIFCGPF